MNMLRDIPRQVPVLGLLLLLAGIAVAAQRSVDQLKSEAEKAEGGHQALLYAELAQELVDVADQQFTDGNSSSAQTTIQDILKYATQARDLSIKTRNKMKDTEIHLRETQRRLDSVKRTLAAEDRPILEEVEKKIEQYRQDILNTMFAPPKKEKKP